MTDFYLMLIKKPFQTFAPNEVYWIDHTNASLINQSFASIHPVDEVFPKYNNHLHLLIVRSGGIGDLLALSVLQNIAPKTTVLTHKKYFAALDWWHNVPTKKDFQKPLVTLEKNQSLKDAFKNTGIMRGEEAIEMGSKKNWYEIFYESVGQKFLHGRPQIKTSSKAKKGCMIVPYATSVNRSADITTILKVASEFFNDIHFHENFRTTEKYLEELSSFEFVISVDTSAIHFREGIGKPALGIYGSFDKESRTKYYQYTKSINIKSPCEIQPCHLRNSVRCPKAKGNEKSAPCLSPGFNPSFEVQLREALKQMY